MTTTQVSLQQIPAQTDNPYWEIVRTMPGNPIDLKYDGVWSPNWAGVYTDEDGYPLKKPIIPAYTRKDLCVRYSWAIPDPLSLEFMKKYIGPCADLNGAGTGYWAWQLVQLGIDMLAYDIDPPHEGYNHYHN